MRAWEGEEERKTEGKKERKKERKESERKRERERRRFDIICVHTGPHQVIEMAIHKITFLMQFEIQFGREILKGISMFIFSNKTMHSAVATAKFTPL